MALGRKALFPSSTIQAFQTPLARACSLLLFDEV
jgi:hypothetical protein